MAVKNAQKEKKDKVGIAEAEIKRLEQLAAEQSGDEQALTKKKIRKI